LNRLSYRALAYIFGNGREFPKKLWRRVSSASVPPLPPGLRTRITDESDLAILSILFSEDLVPGTVQFNLKTLNKKLNTLHFFSTVLKSI